MVHKSVAASSSSYSLGTVGIAIDLNSLTAHIDAQTQNLWRRSFKTHLVNSYITEDVLSKLPPPQHERLRVDVRAAKEKTLLEEKKALSKQIAKIC
jgi:hypothetical protein